MSIKINDTLIKKIIVENTEVFSVYKKFGTPTNQCIWVKPFTFTRDAGASVLCTPGNPQEPSISSTASRQLNAADTIYAFEKITWSHTINYMLSSNTSLIRHFPWKCEVSFLNGSTVVGTKTYTYSNGYAPTVTSTGERIKRTFWENSGMLLFSSIICDSSIISLSDFDKIDFHNKRVGWTTENCNYSLTNSSVTIYRSSSEVAMFPQAITVTSLFTTPTTYIIEPLILSSTSIMPTSFSCGFAIISIGRSGNSYTISGSRAFIQSIVLTKLWVATEE